MELGRAGWGIALVGACAAMLAGCSKPLAAPAPVSTPEVGVVVVRARPVLLSTVLPGRTAPWAISEVRPQATGLIQRRLFVEGKDVKAGQPLYEIDAAPYRVALEQAQAQEAYAEANLLAVRRKVERFRELIKVSGVSRQELDDAEAGFLQATASLRLAHAAVHAARINLDYTVIRAPISGRVGRSLVTPGALVTAGQPQVLTTVQALDPIYVDLSQSAAELVRLRRGLGAEARGSAGTSLSLSFEDGGDYPLPGRLQFADATVEAGTGSVTVRAVFPNPARLLLPGMYVRARLTEMALPSAILAPQQAVLRDSSGRPTAMVVAANGRAQLRMLETGRAVGDSWLVTRGLTPGDRLIVDGVQRVKPGALVKPIALERAGASRRPADDR